MSVDGRIGVSDDDFALTYIFIFLIRIGEIFKDAIRINAAAIVVAHNHPSGIAEPSPEDIGVTKAIREAGKMLDIELLDHIVIGNPRWVSLKERGLGFN